MEETAVLLRAYARAQERCSRLLAEQAAHIVRLRAALIVRESTRAMVRQKAVLCVGQDEAASGVAQRLAEIAGGRCLYHDGKDDADAALESSLRAADLVICQTGCMSHGAYWRVQDHCRRTGKPCVMVGQDASPVAQPIHIVRRGVPVDG